MANILLLGDQIWQFYEVICDKFTKGGFWASFKIKNCLGYILGKIWKNWATFISASGHTDHDDKNCMLGDFSKNRSPLTKQLWSSIWFNSFFETFAPISNEIIYSRAKINEWWIGKLLPKKCHEIWALNNSLALEQKLGPGAQ